MSHRLRRRRALRDLSPRAGQVVNCFRAVVAASVVMGEIGEIVLQIVGGELLNRLCKPARAGALRRSINTELYAASCVSGCLKIADCGLLVDELGELERVPASAPVLPSVWRPSCQRAPV